MLRGEATNINFIVFGLTLPGLELTIYRIRVRIVYCHLVDCDEGWVSYDRHCYKLFNIEDISQREAEDTCQSYATWARTHDLSHSRRARQPLRYRCGLQLLYDIFVCVIHTYMDLLNHISRTSLFR
jgi:hypothetical protein